MTARRDLPVRLERIEAKLAEVLAPAPADHELIALLAADHEIRHAAIDALSDDQLDRLLRLFTVPPAERRGQLN